MLLWVGQFGSVVLLAQWLSAKVFEEHSLHGGQVLWVDVSGGGGGER